MTNKRHSTEIWAQLVLRQSDRDRIRSFFAFEFGIRPSDIIKKIHLTVYHARRPLQGLEDNKMFVEVKLPVSNTRFMVMAPGGENPRPEHDPARRKVGIRVQKSNPAYEVIQQFRSNITKFETADILGSRKFSTRSKSAFGARNFQPHLTLIRAGSRIPTDRTIVGSAFRSIFKELVFDQYLVDVVSARKKYS